jgi:UDP-2-acetamido-3-amino-2,3-dideoxy-glucuronate N-acetyltransferase
VTKDVPDFAIVVGNPARNVGWVGEGGKRLVFDSHGEAVCEKSGMKYQLVGDHVEEIM